MKQGFCPTCGTEITAYEEVEQIENTIYQHFICPNCGAQCTEIFTYTSTLKKFDF